MKCPQLDLGLPHWDQSTRYMSDLTELQVSAVHSDAGHVCVGVQEMSEDMAIETVHEAFRQGINYFDTSPFYGEGLSEIVCARLHNSP